MRTTCLLALLSLWLLAVARAAPKKLEKKSIGNSLAPKAIEPVEQKLDAPSPKISDEALMETPGETVDRAKKQASATICVEIRQNKPAYVDCNESGGGGNKIFVVQGNDLYGPDGVGPNGVGPNGGLPGPATPVVPDHHHGLHGLHGPHVLHLPNLPHGVHGPPHHGVHFSVPGAGGASDGVPATVHYLLPGADGSGFGPGSGGVPFNYPGSGVGPNEGGLNGILYQIPGGFPGEPGSSGVGPNGVHVHVHPSSFPSGVGGPGGSAPNGVHLHLPAGSGGSPSGGSSASPIHLSGIECLCAGTPAVGRDADGNDGTPSNEALAVKFLQDLQKNDNKQDGDVPKASTGGDNSPTDQTPGSPSGAHPKFAGMPMMIGGIPLMRSSQPVPYGSPYSYAYGLPIVGGMPTMGNTPMMRGADGTPMMGDMPMMKGAGGMPMMGGMPMVGGMPMMRIPGGAPMGMPMMGGIPMMRIPGGTPMGMPMMGGMPMMRIPGGTPAMGGAPGAGDMSVMKVTENPKSPDTPITIQLPSSPKSGEDPKNPTSPNGMQLTIMGMPTGKSGDESNGPNANQNGMPVTFLNVPMVKAGDNPTVPILPNGLPVPVMTLAGLRANNQPSDGANSPAGGKTDPSILVRYLPSRPAQYPMQIPIHNPMYSTGPMNPMYPHMPGGFMGPYSPHGFGGVHPMHRSQYDCLQESFQSVPSIQGMRFSRGPDESELPAGGQQVDSDAKSENPPGSEHAEAARSDDKESRISHFIADEHNDAANNV